MLTLKRKTPYALFFAILLTTEFFYIQVGGGVARIYHLLAILIFLGLYRYIPRLFVSSVFWALLGFLLINLIASLHADYPVNVSALSSFLSLAANIGVALATALILVSGRYSFEDLRKLILGITVLAIFWGLVQVFAYKVGGVKLALSEQQVSQISGGFAPAFRTEANTFAKYLNFAFLLLLPSLLRDVNHKKSLGVFAIIFVGMLMSFTRSALYGLSLTVVLAYFWYLFTGRGRLLAPKVMLFLGFGSIALLVFSSQAGSFNEYAAHKIATFFDQQEITEGGSSAFRLMSQRHLIDAFFATEQSFFFGNGWGQVFFDYGGIQWQAGGAEILTVLAYGGIFSGLLYLVYSISALNASRKIAVLHPTTSHASMYEGVMFAILGSVITGQINGAMIAPEYWMMYGIAIYFGYRLQMDQRFVKKLNYEKLR